MASKENAANEHILDSLNSNTVRCWWKGFSQIICDTQMKSRIPIKYLEENDQDFDYDFLLKTAAQLTKGDQEKKVKILSYIVETEPGLKALIAFFKCDQFRSLYLEVSVILRETTNPKNGVVLRAAAINQTISCSYLQVFMDMLVPLQNKCAESFSAAGEDKLSIKSHDTCQLAIMNYLWFLSAIAQKDNKFAVKIGLMSKVKFVHELLQTTFFYKVNAHYPVLKILRKLSRNFKVSHILGKDKIMKTIKRMFSAINPKDPALKSQLFLDIIVQLTKDKANSRRFVQAGCLQSLLRCFQYFSTTWEGKPLYKLSKAIVSIYTEISHSRLGRKSLVQTQALTHLSEFCKRCSSEKCYNGIVVKSIALVALSYDSYKLPLKNISNPARFGIHVRKTEYLDGAIGEKAGESESSGEEDETGGGESNSDSGSSEDDPEEKERFSFTDTETDEADEGGTTSDPENSHENQIFKANDVAKSSEDSDSRSFHSSATVYKKADFQELMEYGKFYKEFDKNYDIFHNETRKQTTVFNRRNSRDRRPSVTTYSDNINRFSDFSNTSKEQLSLEATYARFSNCIHNVIPFVKIPYPDLTLALSTENTELQNNPTEKSEIRGKLLRLMARITEPQIFEPKFIYDFDENLLRSGSISRNGSRKRRNSKTFKESLSNNDKMEVGSFDENLPLKFESRFECGNLRKAIQIDVHEYDLLLMSDINSDSHNQWFYFQVSNMEQIVEYTFNIINCIKGSSQFNQGMQPVMFSCADAFSGKPHWTRCGKNICYFKNGYKNTTGTKTKSYYTVSFTVQFKNRGDIVYIAYHIPYTYTRLLSEIDKLLRISSVNDKLIFRSDDICQTLNKNDLPLLTVTARNDFNFPLEKRDIIFLTSRVHPGETNASWIMQGVLDDLINNPKNENLLQKYIFKIVPMLNVEGVLNGCTRCGLSAEDLNRRWKTPSKVLNPTIYHSKMLLEYCCRVQEKVPVVFCDFHGHSKKKNVFLYGCSFARSWLPEDRLRPEDPQAIHEFPEAIGRNVPALSLSQCNYEIRQSRETTARVAVWRDFNIIRSYTLECSYCGCDEGTLKGTCFGTKDLLEIGKGFCKALHELQIN